MSNVLYLVMQLEPDATMEFMPVTSEEQVTAIMQEYRGSGTYTVSKANGRITETYRPYALAALRQEDIFSFEVWQSQLQAMDAPYVQQAPQVEEDVLLKDFPLPPSHEFEPVSDSFTMPENPFVRAEGGV